MAKLPVRLKRRYEYRLVWQYKGSTYKRQLISQTSTNILNMLRRLATDEPWMGVNGKTMRKAWMRLALKSDVPFNAIRHLQLREVLRQLQQAYGTLAYIRVEIRQVGEWTELIDPLRSLQTDSSHRADERKLRELAAIDAMTPEQLDEWRQTPNALYKESHA